MSLNVNIQFNKKDICNGVRLKRLPSGIFSLDHEIILNDFPGIITLNYFPANKKDAFEEEPIVQLKNPAWDID
ncbi:hypothetical protein EHQ61_00745 [Leptospira wolffii]|uniref:hypothetical protein n=1 Tax=Leptospira wolffii TaxID=409998 RepID=UPI0010830484|nr:hypothetical protein [Leptospira wolffii]TGL55271.1 hypothetical protein EHQ61_00745 [Leptospira wolffii]